MTDRKVELENLIKMYAESYYSGTALVSDEYFDQLVEELRNLDSSSEVLNSAGWGYNPNDAKKVSHLHGLYIGSLSKVKSYDSIPQRFKDSYVRISAKLDGLSVVSYYKDGKRFLSLTRGNGYTGIDVTAKITKILNDSNKIVRLKDGRPFSGAVRGEVVMSQEVWESKYRPFLDSPTNPRNIASGILNRDYINNEINNLSYVVYKVLYDESVTLTNIDDVNYFLEVNFDDVVDYQEAVIVDGLLEKLFSSFSKYFPCDGLVITKINQNNSSTVNYDEISYKFKAESEEVVVKEVIYEASRTGRIVPVITFDPVELSGASVKKCTGYNAEFIRANKIGPGSVIEVCRSNEVIPTVVRVVSPADKGQLPEYCPHCSADLVWKGTDLVCEYENESNLSYRFIKTVAPVDGAGWKLYSKIVESLCLDNEEELCEFLFVIKNGGIDHAIRAIDYAKLISGLVTWGKVIEILKKLSQPIDPRDFLVACNINGVSWKTAQQIFETYDNFLDEIDNLNIEKLYSIPGIGSKTVETLVKFNKRVSNLYKNVNIKKINNDESEKESTGLKFKVAITGSLSIKRSDFESLLNKAGIEIGSNFKEIKYLITNNPDSGSSKMKKAKENGVEVISEQDFVDKFLKVVG